MAGHDPRAVALYERRALLERVHAGASHPLVQFSKALVGAPADILDAACTMQLEGVMCKHADAPYSDGRRSTAWRKLKCGKREALVIGGYLASSRGVLQKLLLGGGGRGEPLIYAGSVGTGFADKARRDLGKALSMISSEESPFAPGRGPVVGIWVQPLLVADIRFAEWTKAGRVRHPVFRGVKARA